MTAALQPTLVKEFKYAYMTALSPEGDRICLFSTKHPLATFGARGRARTYSGGSSSDEALVIVRTVSWNELYSVKLLEKPSKVSFFSQGEKLYAETRAIAPDFHTNQQLVIDIRERKQDERIQAYQSMYYLALSDDTLLGVQETPGKKRFLSAKLPGYDETRRAGFGQEPTTSSFGLQGGVVTADDRNTFVYSYDHAIVYRRIHDFGIIWTQTVDPKYPYGVARLAISADGSRIAAAMIDTTFAQAQRQYGVGVYETKGGRQVATLPVKGDGALAMSPNGNLIAIGKVVPMERGGDLQLTVEIYDITTARRVAFVVHDRFADRDLFIQGSFAPEGIVFTSDGKYLITSTIHTKVWALDVLT